MLWQTHCLYYTFYSSPQQCYSGPTVRTIPFMAPLSNVIADPLFVSSDTLYLTHLSYYTFYSSPQVRYGVRTILFMAPLSNVMVIYRSYYAFYGSPPRNIMVNISLF